MESASGQAKRAKYHDESMKVSKVSVSRRAGSPDSGSTVSTKSAMVASGEPPPETATSSGRRTGRSESGTGRSCPDSVCRIGTGQPQ